MRQNIPDQIPQPPACQEDGTNPAVPERKPVPQTLWEPAASFPINKPALKEMLLRQDKHLALLQPLPFTPAIQRRESVNLWEILLPHQIVKLKPEKLVPAILLAEEHALLLHKPTTTAVLPAVKQFKPLLLKIANQKPEEKPVQRHQPVIIPASSIPFAIKPRPQIPAKQHHHTMTV